ncbi:MAG: hypothetical protein D6726_07305 [Nitrospirae bacterium]|nr:MAG: hypothetical protein D6726_07305 [Nitrospirota bacterium]
MLLPVVVYFVLPSDKKRIRNLIMEGREAALNKDIDGVMRHVSYNYRDRYGFSYLYLKETFRNLFKRVDAFEIEIDSLRIKVDDRKAEARFNLVVKTIKDGTEGYLMGGEGFPESVVFTLEKEKMKWQVVETYLPTREGIDF